MPASYLLLEVQVLILSELGAPLPVERPSLDGLKMLLVLGTPELVTFKLHGGAGAFPMSVPPGPLCGELLRSHLLLGMINNAKRGWKRKRMVT